MFARIRKRFTCANVVMTIALVFAMGGGAYAASKYVITSTKQISPKVLKALQGKAGSTGANGANGSAGPAGEKGATGEKGTAGTNGTSGANGESVVSATLKPGAHCLEGGSEFKVGAAASTYVCNGVPGPKGQAGSPWTAGGTLPAGATETGTWGGNVYQDATDLTLSFPIPLATVLKSSEVHIIGGGEGEGEANESPAIKAGECKGKFTEPGAKEGDLCVFVETIGDNTSGDDTAGPIVDFFHEPAELGAGTMGAILVVKVEKADFGEPEYGANVFGTWAVTG